MPERDVRLVVPPPTSQGHAPQASPAGVHRGALELSGFEDAPLPAGFGPLWRAYRVDSPRMHGSFYTCAPGDGWQISIHDFTLLEDTVLTFEGPQYVSVGWYESISGEQFDPYRRLRPASLFGFDTAGGWRGLIHGNIAMRSLTIEVVSALSQAYVDREYAGDVGRMHEALASLNEGADLPELRALLEGLWPRPGDEPHAVTYYAGKVYEALGLLVEHSNCLARQRAGSLSEQDRCLVMEVARLIDDHCTETLRMTDLARIACMSPSKFKECFRLATGQTFTRYVQGRRMAMARDLLRCDELSIEQVAHAVGYTSASRFSEVFRRETGMLPSQMRRASG